MLRPKNTLQPTVKTALIGVAALFLLYLLLSGRGSRSSSSSASSTYQRLDDDDDDDNNDDDGGSDQGKSKSKSSKTSSTAPGAVVMESPPRIHSTEAFVPAGAFSGALRKPLEMVGTLVSCPERGGKNTQCGKVSAEYRFKVKDPGDYFLYVQVTAPGLNDNSLWVGLVEGAEQDAFDACKTPSGESAGPLIPHKHVSSKKFLCCPAYLAKNKKKGLAGFYSDCCYSGLGKDGNEVGCVLDLEVDEKLRWNELPRTIRTTKSNAVVSIRIYAREDGTSWGGLVLSGKSTLDAGDLAKMKKSTA